MAIITAVDNKAGVLFFNNLYKEWCDKVEDHVMNLNAVYRLADTRKRPTLNWDMIDREYNWCARDAMGFVRVFSSKPETHRIYKIWTPAGQVGVIHKCLVGVYDPGEVDWKDSLISRPGVE